MSATLDDRLQPVLDILDAKHVDEADPRRPLKHSERKKLARLRRRLDYLTALIEDGEANGWDKGEAASLAWAIKTITDLRPERAEEATLDRAIASASKRILSDAKAMRPIRRVVTEYAIRWDGDTAQVEPNFITTEALDANHRYILECDEDLAKYKPVRVQRTVTFTDWTEVQSS